MSKTFKLGSIAISRRTLLHVAAGEDPGFFGGV